MLKIGIIGSGDIVQKAYLPVISTKAVEVHFFARNSERMNNLASQFGIKNLHSSLGSLINSGIKGALVHTSTASHQDIVRQLLSHNIHVYVDKPVTYDLDSSEELFALAKEKSLHLMVGFNRRYAPAYRKLKELQNINMIVMQKNRKSLPGDIRTFIFDDYIHVADTILYLLPSPLEKISVAGKEMNGLLHHVVVQFFAANGFIATGIMNRDSGVVEEQLEIFTPDEKWVVTNVAETVVYRNRDEVKIGADDWERTLYKRGFEKVVDEFVASLRDGTRNHQIPDPLETHRICEEIVVGLSG